MSKIFGKMSIEEMKIKSDETHAQNMSFLGLSSDENVEQKYGIPLTYVRAYVKMLTTPKSMKMKVKFKCLGCSCYQRSEIINCTVKTCALWSTRPYQK